jgi:ATP-dependent exoDNAse (exonuclease V) beta subunit
VLERYIDAIAWRSWAHEAETVRQDNQRRLSALVAAAMTSRAWSALSSGVVLPELPVAIFLDDVAGSQLVEGVLDALVFNASEATVIDWKSAASEQRFAGLRDAYDAQGALYASIVERRTGLRTNSLVQPLREG